jgi:hypothetical protein
MNKTWKMVLGFLCVAVLLATPPLMETYADADASPDASEAHQNDVDTGVDPAKSLPATSTNVAIQEPTTNELIDDAQSMVNDWRALGGIAGVIALLQLLMKLLKFRPINDIMTAKKIKWTKPYISAVLGVILVGLTTYSNVGNLPNSIVTGFLFGAASTGWNEMLNKKNPKKRMS